MAGSKPKAWFDMGDKLREAGNGAVEGSMSIELLVSGSFVNWHCVYCAVAVVLKPMK